MDRDIILENMKGQDLRDTSKFFNKRLHCVNFKESILINIKFMNTEISYCNFSGSDLRSSYFTSYDDPNVSVNNCDFSYAIINNSSINTKISHCNFSNCDLRNSYFNCFDRKVEMNNCNFTNANLSHSFMHSCRMTHCNFTNANLTNVNFKISNLNYLNFKNAILDNSDLKFASLQGSIFKNTSLKNVRFIGTYMKDVIGLEKNLKRSSASLENVGFGRQWPRCK